MERPRTTTLVLGVICLFTGLCIFLSRYSEAKTANPDIGTLIKRLQKQETPLHKAKQALWAKLPSLFTSRFPQLEPRPAAIIRREAAESIGSLDAPTKEGILALTKALKDPDMWVQIAATRSLTRFGPSAIIALPELIKRFQSATTNQQVMLDDCVEALVNIAPESDAVAMALLDAIEKDIPPPNPPSGAIS